jgi:hypothetical protein
MCFDPGDSAAAAGGAQADRDRHGLLVANGRHYVPALGVVPMGLAEGVVAVDGASTDPGTPVHLKVRMLAQHGWPSPVRACSSLGVRFWVLVSWCSS